MMEKDTKLIFFSFRNDLCLFLWSCTFRPWRSIFVPWWNLVERIVNHVLARIIEPVFPISIDFPGMSKTMWTFFSRLNTSYLLMKDFVRSYFFPNATLTSWTFLDHFCHHFWVGLLLLCCCTHPKVMTKMAKKCSTDQRFMRKRITTYRIHTLVRSTLPQNYLLFYLFTWTNLKCCYFFSEDKWNSAQSLSVCCGKILSLLK